MPAENSFKADVEFLSQHFETHVLSNGEGSKVAVVPALQGRTMTSTAQGDDGCSFGYINYNVFGQKELDPQINLYGGEDRIWISPEGGQFSIYFDPDVPMDFEHWRCPPFLDTAVFDVVEKADQVITFRKSTTLKNMSNYSFDVELDRTVELLDVENVAGLLNTDLAGLNVAAHESRNRLTNLGSETWQQKTGLLALWSLCMSKPSPGASLIIPFRKGPESELGSIVTSDYFGELDSSRLSVNESLGLICMRGDGEYRSKLGISQKRALPLLGSWDRDRKVLTVAQFSMPDSAPHGYTNNLWEVQEEPFVGDVINGYNDGPNSSGGKLGGFYELETISPALALSPSESYTHTQRTIRIEGDVTKLDAVSRSVFGVSLSEVESQLDPPDPSTA